MEIHSLIDPYAIHYDTFTGDVYTLATAGITLTNGEFNGIIGGTTPVAGTFSSLKVAFDGPNNFTIVVNSEGNAIIRATGGDISFSNENLSTTGTLTATTIGAFQAVGAIDFNSQNMTNVDIDSGTINSVTIASSPISGASGSFTTLAASAAATFDTTVVVNAGNAAQNYLTIEGYNPPGSLSRGGGIVFWGYAGVTQSGFMYYTLQNRRIVFNTTPQSAYDDYGNAWIEVDSGNASFGSVLMTDLIVSAGDFQVDASGAVSCSKVSIAGVTTGEINILAASGNIAKISMSADANEDNIDRWKIQVDDGGLLKFQNFASGAFVSQMTMTPANPMTDAVINITGALALHDGKELRFWDVGNSHYVGFKSPALTATQLWTLPTADGSAGDVLSTDGAGNLEWATGAAFGSCYGNHINWLANDDDDDKADQNVWYDIADADMTADADALHDVTHDGNGKLTVSTAGLYFVAWSCCFEDDTANDHIETGISVSGTVNAGGLGHIENKFANEEEHLSSGTILDLEANATLQVSIRTTDAVAPEITVHAVNLSCVFVETSSSSGGWDGIRVIEDHAGNDTLTNAEAGSVHTNKGAGGVITLTLPDPGIEGVVFTFCVNAVQQLRIDPQSATIIDNAGQTANKYEWADAIGETLSLICDAAGDWLVIAKNGTWSEEA